MFRTTCLVIFAALGVLAAPFSALGTVLTFDIRYNSNNSYWGDTQSMEYDVLNPYDLSDYGDNVSSTPTTKIMGPYDVWYNYDTPSTPNVVVDYDTPGGVLR